MSNFNQGDVYAAAIILPTLGTAAVAARFYVRSMKKTPLLGDDWSVLLGLLLTWTTGVIMIIGAALGAVGTHTVFNPRTGLPILNDTSNNTAKLYFAFMLCFTLAIGVIKFSLLLLYRRIFVSQTAQRLSLGLCIFVGIWTLAFFLARILECGSHVSAAWDPLRIKKYCLAQQSIDTSFAVTDVATDLMVLASPLPFIWQLRMSLASRISVTCIFMLGLMATAAGSTRLAFVVIYDYRSVTGKRDVQAIGTTMMMWAQIEAGVACVAACLPTLRPLYKGKSPESLINSVRSRLSPLRSRTSSKETISDIEKVDDVHKLFGSERTPRQSTIVKSASDGEEGRLYEIPHDRILVQNSISQERVPREFQ